MSLNFGFNVGVRSGHHQHPNTVEAAKLLQECIHFFGPLCILLYILECIFVTSCVLFYCTACTAVVCTLVAALLARSQYPEGPATGHLGIGFSWFPCV